VDILWITLASAVVKKMPGELCSTRAVVRSTVDEGGPPAAVSGAEREGYEGCAASTVAL